MSSLHVLQQTDEWFNPNSFCHVETKLTIGTIVSLNVFFKLKEKIAKFKFWF